RDSNDWALPAQRRIAVFKYLSACGIGDYVSLMFGKVIEGRAKPACGVWQINLVREAFIARSRRFLNRVADWSAWVGALDERNQARIAFDREFTAGGGKFRDQA